MGQRQMDMARLAEATGFAVSTIEIAMTRRSPPSRPILAALRVWLAGPGEAQAAEEPPQAPGGSNGASRCCRHRWPPWRQQRRGADLVDQGRREHPPRPLRSRSWPSPGLRRFASAPIPTSVRGRPRNDANHCPVPGCTRPGVATRGDYCARHLCPDPGPAADRQRSDPAELCRADAGGVRAGRMGECHDRDILEKTP